ncbi:MAG: sigma-54 dependent transcriptional regulator [Patescibacteria group bacterium]
MTERPLILICDDDAEFLKSLQLSLRSNFEIHAANTVVQAKALAGRYEYDAAIIDLNFEGQELDGIHLLDHMGKRSPGTFLIVLSGDKSVRRVVEAMRRKLFEFVHKEGDFFYQLHSSLTRATQLKRAKAAQAAQRYLTESPQVKEILKTAERILASSMDAPILIVGETGSCKEFLTQHIAHALKMRLVAANMGGIPKDMAESILFGHERGAFTGAVANKMGMIESAHDGIFFLDEIGECTPAVQAKLLRVLQEKEVHPLGAIRPRKIKVRFIAATNRELEQMVSEGTFRLDLLQRLNTFVLRLPPLRARPEDILFYANLFLEECGDADVCYTITPEGAKTLLAHPWPGNTRELKSVIQRIVVLSNKRIIDANTVLEAIGLGKDPSANSVGHSKVAVLEDNFRRGELIKALKDSGGNKRMTAKGLGVSEATVYRWVKDFGINALGARR